MDYDYWKKQSPESPLFPNIEWNKPEQRKLAGKLGIVGGNKLGFAGLAEAYTVATKTGAGEVRVLMPDVLKKTIPATLTEAIFAPSNVSGGLSKEAEANLRTIGNWADGILLIGDAGRNSETAIVYEKFIQEYKGMLTVTRDAIDLVKNSATLLADRPQTVMVMSFAQLQKLFQSVYYPKVLTFSMQLTNLVEALHKFTITYPITITVLHHDTVVLAHNGDVVTTPWDNAMLIWRGTVAAKAATYWLWEQNKPLESIATSLVS